MKKSIFSLFVATSLLMGACSTDDVTEDTTTSTGSTITNVAYASTSSAQKMDIYLPEGNGPFPVVVIIHGGAFMMGDKSGEASNAAALVANGIAAVSINYRLSSEAQYPAQIQDCKAAVRFLRANATKYNLNPDKIGSWGASAGGNLSSLLGTTSGISELEGASLGNSSYSSKVIASVDWFGPINFLTMDAEATALGFTINTNSSTSPESKLMGAAVQTIPTQVASNIPYTQSLNFYNALKTVKGSSDVSYELLDGAGHGGSQFSASSNMAKVTAFFNKYLK